MNHAQNLRDLSHSLLRDGRTREADECDEAASEINRLLAIELEYNRCRDHIVTSVNRDSTTVVRLRVELHKR